MSECIRWKPVLDKLKVYMQKPSVERGQEIMMTLYDLNKKSDLGKQMSSHFFYLFEINPADLLKGKPVYPPKPIVNKYLS